VEGIEAAKYSENRDFCPGLTGLSSKTTRQIKRLDLKFVTRADQWNFFADQRISRALTME
jgi:hypothetical protein